MWAKVDDRGRVYLPKQVRGKVGREVFVIAVKDGILLIPKPNDPFRELEELGKKLPDRTVRELRKEIEDLAMEEIE